MSVINKMLQELDRRQAIPGAQASLPGEVRPVDSSERRSEWFWRIVAALMLAALAWTGWVAYQLRSAHPVATDLAFKAAEEARARQGRIAVAAPPAPQAAAPAQKPADAVPPADASAATRPQKVQEAAKSQPVPQAPAAAIAAPPKPPAPTVQPSPPPPAQSARPAPVPDRKPDTMPPNLLARLAFPPAKVLRGVPSKPRVERRDHAVEPAQQAEREFRHAALLLNQARVPEAEAGFARALKLDPSHRAARQALVALSLDQGRLDLARGLLQESLAGDPTQPDFAVALARILVERQDFAGALDALQGAAPAAGDYPELQALRGVILQKLGRHDEAIEAFEAALRIRASLPNAWIGLGISLEALKRRPEAAEAFRRGLATRPESAELREFAEQRVRALR